MFENRPGPPSPAASPPVTPESRSPPVKPVNVKFIGGAVTRLTFGAPVSTWNMS
ncbi:MAG: hypothetical protein ACYTCU_08935 [Planctomycetota bacterium]|jgi:hypothetical protein